MENSSEFPNEVLRIEDQEEWRKVKDQIRKSTQMEWIKYYAQIRIYLLVILGG